MAGRYAPLGAGLVTGRYNPLGTGLATGRYAPLGATCLRTGRRAVVVAGSSSSNQPSNQLTALPPASSPSSPLRSYPASHSSQLLPPLSFFSGPAPPLTLLRSYPAFTRTNVTMVSSSSTPSPEMYAVYLAFFAISLLPVDLPAYGLGRVAFSPAGGPTGLWPR